MLSQGTRAGTPKLTMKWPKNSVISTRIQQNAAGRFVCQVKVNDGDYFSLPSSHPTEADAQHTLLAYVQENMEQSETK